VAIVGAGPAGLACAVELERRGVQPDIFERRYRVGLPHPLPMVLLHPFSAGGVRDQISFLRDGLGIHLDPLQPLGRIVMHGPTRKAVVGGALGYILERGQGPGSVESQLLRQVTTPVTYNHHADYRSLAREYDYVVVADGRPDVARTLGYWRPHGRVCMRGAVILGRFEPRTVHMYLDTSYARQGFAVEVPFGPHHAALLLVVTDIRSDELNDYWAQFLYRTGKSPEIVETFESEQEVGLVSRRTHRNLLLAGNAGGFTETCLGLGLFAAVVSGVLAARAVTEDRDFEALARPLVSHAERMHLLRAALDRMNNRDLDRLVAALGLPGVRHLFYNARLNPMRLVSAVLALAARRAATGGK
jgi:flavin-dependent dehydrogenase